MFKPGDKVRLSPLGEKTDRSRKSHGGPTFIGMRGQVVEASENWVNVLWGSKRYMHNNLSLVNITRSAEELSKLKEDV